MKKTKKIFAVILTLFMGITSGMVQTAFAEPVDGTESGSASTSPYIYQHDPDIWYQNRSPHRFSYSELIEGTWEPQGTTYGTAIYRLLSGENNSTVDFGYCCDLKTAVKVGTYYKRLNLDESGYYDKTSAAHIRTILKHGYWTYGDNNARSIDELKTIEGVTDLTNAEALAATQHAIWHYANGGSEGGAVVTELYTKSVASDGGEHSGRIKDKVTVECDENNGGADGKYVEKTGNNINKVYNYLINLEGEESEPEIWNFENEGYYIAVEDNGRSFDATVSFKMNGNTDNKEGLTLTVKPVMKENSDATPIAEENISLKDVENGSPLYKVRFTDLTEKQVRAIGSVKITLSGTQSVKEDVYFYEPMGGRTAAQCFVGLASGTTPVYREWTMNINTTEKSLELIKYDENSVVQASEDNPAEKLKAQGMTEVIKDGYVKYAFPVTGAKFELYARITDTDKTVNDVKIGTAVTDSDGKIKWNILEDADNVTYYCKEIEAPRGYVLPDGQITYDLKSDVARTYISNCHDTGVLTIGKVVEGADTEEHFNFEVRIDLTKAEAYSRLNESEKTIGENYSEIEWTKKADSDEESAFHPSAIVWTNNKDVLTAKIRLAGDETLTINGLPTGAECTVTELDENGDEIQEESDGTGTLKYGSILYKSKDIEQTVTIKADTAAGIAGNDTAISFINTETGEFNEMVDGDNSNDATSNSSQEDFETRDATVNTGDNTSPALWLMIMLLSAIALCGTALTGFKKR